MEVPGGVTAGLINTDERVSVKHLPSSVLMPSLYDNLPPEQSNSNISTSIQFSSAIASRLGLTLPNPAPDVDYLTPPQEPPQPITPQLTDMEPKKKKYAKEAWPGKKPLPTLLV